jgi:hypothetical protein
VAIEFRRSTWESDVGLIRGEGGDEPGGRRAPSTACAPADAPWQVLSVAMQDPIDRRPGGAAVSMSNSFFWPRCRLLYPSQ